MRPCTCENVRPGPYTAGQCRLCWLYRNDPAYKALWGAPAPGGGRSAPATRSLPCAFLGPVLDQAGCDCPARWLRACEVHKVTTIARCKECPDYEEA